GMAFALKQPGGETADVARPTDDKQAHGKLLDKHDRRCECAAGSVRSRPCGRDTVEAGLHPTPGGTKQLNEKARQPVNGPECPRGEAPGLQAPRPSEVATRNTAVAGVVVKIAEVEEKVSEAPTDLFPSQCVPEERVVSQVLVQDVELIFEHHDGPATR